MTARPYDRLAAVTYARKWALSRNPQYYDFENIIYPGIPEFFRRSQNDASIAYLGTSHALIIYDLKHHVAIHSYPMIFGAQNVTEFGDTIFVSSYDGVKLISLK